MPNKCGYKPCKRDDLAYSLTHIVTPRLVTTHYCSPIHIILGVLVEWIEQTTTEGHKTLKRLLLTAKAVAEKIETAARKEWLGTADKVK